VKLTSIYTSTAPALLTTVPCLSSSELNMADNSVIILAHQINMLTMMVPVRQHAIIPIKLQPEVVKIIVTSLVVSTNGFTITKPVVKNVLGL